MERAGTDEMPDEAERKGIGTSATRAATIEKLVRIGFVERKGNKKTKYLIPTHKGTALITVMPEQIQSPSITAEWEQKLLDVEKGSYADSSFMTEIEEMMKKMEGLSSQVINGNFSMTDRLNFQREIKELTLELSRAGGNGISFTKNDNVQLSQKMNDLTRMINEAAVYHRNASAVFMVKNRQTAGMQRTFLDIAI